MLTWKSKLHCWFQVVGQLLSEGLVCTKPESFILATVTGKEAKVEVQTDLRVCGHVYLYFAKDFPSVALSTPS